jgi:hypothetical protein
MSRLAFAFVAMIATAGLASAQPAADGPPGTCACPPTSIAAATAPELPRFAVSLHATSLYASPTRGSDPATDFAGGGFDVRVRLHTRWELGVSVDGGSHHADDGTDTGRAIGLALVGGRFHPAPYATWDLYATGGVGVASLGLRDASGAPPKADRGVAMIGGGIERRFSIGYGSIAVGAELRGFAMGARKTESGARPLTSVSTWSGDSGAIGGTLSLAASYEF